MISTLTILITLAAPAPATDAASGLVIAQGWDLVRAHCGACHSHALLTQQRGDELFWADIIARMQRDHGLWHIGTAQQETMTGYLAEHYAPDDQANARVRRLPLAPHLMPRP